MSKYKEAIINLYEENCNNFGNDDFNPYNWISGWVNSSKQKHKLKSSAVYHYFDKYMTELLKYYDIKHGNDNFFKEDTLRNHDLKRLLGWDMNDSSTVSLSQRLDTWSPVRQDYYCCSLDAHDSVMITMTQNERDNLIRANFNEFEKTFIPKMERISGKFKAKIKLKSINDSKKKLYGNSVSSTFISFMNENFEGWEETDYTGKSLKPGIIYSNKPNFIVNGIAKVPNIKLNNSIRITRVDDTGVICEFRIRSYKMEQKEIDIKKFKEDLTGKLNNILLYLK